MMTRYALMYSRLDVATRKQETVVAYYAEGTITADVHDYIQAPRGAAEQTMIERGWRYTKSAGPGSILMQHA